MATRHRRGVASPVRSEADGSEGVHPRDGLWAQANATAGALHQFNEGGFITRIETLDEQCVRGDFGPGGVGDRDGRTLQLGSRNRIGETGGGGNNRRGVGGLE